MYHTGALVNGAGGGKISTIRHMLLPFLRNPGCQSVVPTGTAMMYLVYICNEQVPDMLAKEDHSNLVLLSMWPSGYLTKGDDNIDALLYVALV